MADFLFRKKISLFGNADPVSAGCVARISPNLLIGQSEHWIIFCGWNVTFWTFLPPHCGWSRTRPLFDMVICSKGNRCRARQQHPNLILTENNFRNSTRPTHLFRTCNFCRNRLLYSPRRAVNPNWYCTLCRQVREPREFVEGFTIFNLLTDFSIGGSICSFCQQSILSNPESVTLTPSHHRARPRRRFLSPPSSPSSIGSRNQGSALSYPPPTFQIIPATPEEAANSSHFHVISPGTAQQGLPQPSPLHIRPQRRRRPTRHFDSSPDLTLQCHRCKTDKPRDHFPPYLMVFMVCNTCQEQVERKYSYLTFRLLIDSSRIRHCPFYLTFVYLNLHHQHRHLLHCPNHLRSSRISLPLCRRICGPHIYNVWSTIFVLTYRSSFCPTALLVCVFTSLQGHHK